MELFELAESDSFKPPESSGPLIVPLKEWRARMCEEFYLVDWEDVIPWDSFFLVGGSVLRCLLARSFVPDDPQDLDFFAVELEFYDWKSKFAGVVKALRDRGATVVHPDYLDQYVRTLHVKLPGSRTAEIKMQFVWYDQRMARERVLNVFDLDPCMVGYDGVRVLASLPFFQSVSTRTCINYKLVNSAENISTFISRTIKYATRGFALLVPRGFDRTLLGQLPLSSRAFRDSVAMLKQQVKGSSVRHSTYAGFLMNNDSLGVRAAFERFLMKSGI
eukprot:m51a1_g5598 hypothetical protein (275) ;mRNA; r:673435-674259